jgi:peptide/nickel transport system substrate-binding protein
MNPRQTVDAIGQRLQAFLFRALTRVDADLETQPDLADGWKAEDGGKTYRFRLAKGAVDHRGRAITSGLLRKCFENYFVGEPKSPFRASFPNWKAVESTADELVIRLHAPDPYLPKNLSLIRYFGFENDPENPCREPLDTDVFVANGDYEARPYPLRLEARITLHARASDAPDLAFEVVRDETARLLKLLNGESELVLNSFSPTKTDWIVADPKHGYRLVQREGTNSSYLAFNMKDPLLSRPEVRRAIAHAIDREKIVRNLLRGQGSLASSFLSPSLPEGIPTVSFSYDPKRSEELLDRAGLPRGPDGVRLRFKYKTTTQKFGLEFAQVFQEMLSRVGIAIELDPVESSVFFASIRKGNFQMYMGRWIGVSDGSIFHRTLHSESADNRVRYRDSEIDAWVEAASSELDLSKRKALLAKVQAKMLVDLPYFPLWHWSNALIFRDTVAPPAVSDISLSGSYTPFARLRFVK